MKNSESLVLIYTGTEVSVILLKAKLEEAGIAVFVKNDYHSGVIAGFTGGVPSAIDVFIQKSGLKRAKPIIGAFSKGI